MKVLTEQQVAAYRHDGFLYPFPMLAPTERAAAIAGLDRYEHWLGSPVPKADPKWRSMPYLCLPWAAAIARDPRILDVVEDLIGPDILIWTSTFFIKEPMSPTFAAWHQDGTYFGLEPAEQITVWVALTDASREAGCMEVLSSRGAARQLHHATLGLENSINRAGQAIVEPLDEREPVTMALEAGSFSLHNTYCVHRSAPNHASHRRVGLGLNYIPAYARATGSVRTAAMLVRGTDRWGHFDLLEPPAGELDPAGLAAHGHAVSLYQQNYAEQQTRHDRQFAGAG